MPKGTLKEMRVLVRVHLHLTRDRVHHLQIEVGKNVVREIKERSHLLLVNHHAKQVLIRKGEIKREILRVQVQIIIKNLGSLVQREKVTRIAEEIVKEDDQGLGQVTVQEEEALRESRDEDIDLLLSHREITIDHTGGIE